MNTLLLFRGDASQLANVVGVGGTVTVYAGATIGDRIWEDVDADGVQDPGEPGLDGVTVELRGPSGLIATTTTAGGGAYQFDRLFPG